MQRRGSALIWRRLRGAVRRVGQAGKPVLRPTGHAVAPISSVAIFHQQWSKSVREFSRQNRFLAETTRMARDAARSWRETCRNQRLLPTPSPPPPYLPWNRAPPPRCPPSRPPPRSFPPAPYPVTH